jgi:hypothetical protein
MFARELAIDPVLLKDGEVPYKKTIICKKVLQSKGTIMSNETKTRESVIIALVSHDYTNI